MHARLGHTSRRVTNVRAIFLINDFQRSSRGYTITGNIWLVTVAYIL